MKPLGRRGFLRAIGLSPIAAKKLADKAIADATGFNPLGADGLNQYGSPGPPLQIDQIAAAKRRSSLLSFFRQFGGLPDWEVERIRNETAVYALDPDIAALRSFSMAVKIGMQRERNIARQVERARGQPAYEQMREEFQKRHGFWFWW